MFFLIMQIYSGLLHFRLLVSNETLVIIHVHFVQIQMKRKWQKHSEFKPLKIFWKKRQVLWIKVLIKSIIKHIS